MPRRNHHRRVVAQRAPGSSLTARRAREFQRRAQPVVSVDTKKKELVGTSRMPGESGIPQGLPPAVRVHAFQDDELGQAIPCAVYDLGANAGWVGVGIDHDTRGEEFQGCILPALHAAFAPTKSMTRALVSSDTVFDGPSCAAF